MEKARAVAEARSRAEALKATHEAALRDAQLQLEIAEENIRNISSNESSSSSASSSSSSSSKSTNSSSEVTAAKKATGVCKD